MAENPYVNKVQMADGTVLIDLTEDTITANHMLAGTVAHDCAGATTTGTIQTYDGSYTIASNN